MMSEPAGVRGTEHSSTAKLTRTDVYKFLCTPCDNALTDLFKVEKQGNRTVLCGVSLGRGE